MFSLSAGPSLRGTSLLPTDKSCKRYQILCSDTENSLSTPVLRSSKGLFPPILSFGIHRLELISQTPGIPVSSNPPVIAACEILPQHLRARHLVLAIRELLIPNRGPRALLLPSAPLDPRDRVVVGCTIRLRLPHDWITLFIHDARRKSGARTRKPGILVLPVGGDVCVLAEVVGTMTLERAELVSRLRSLGRGRVLVRFLNLVAEAGTTGEFGFTGWLN